jgi:hypothetical protein
VKKFANEDELRKFALAKGATASVGESEFNSSRQRANIRPRPTPKAAPSPPPVPPAPVKETVVVDSGAAAEATRFQTEIMTRLFDELREEIRAAATSGISAPSEWDFTIERDRNGLISKITARATRAKVH